MTDSTINQQDLGILARTIIDSNMYMVLGTADAVWATLGVARVLRGCGI